MAGDKQRSGCSIPLVVLLVLAALLLLSWQGGLHLRSPATTELRPSLVGENPSVVTLDHSFGGVSEQYSSATDDKTKGLVEVQVLFGTDRKPVTLDVLTNADRFKPKFAWGIGALVAGGVALLLLRQFLGQLSILVGIGLLLFGVIEILWGGALWYYPPVFIKSPTSFGGDSADIGVIHYGTCTVSVPKDHRKGTLETPSILNFELNENPERHFVVKTVTKYSEELFYEILKTRLNEAREIGKLKPTEKMLRDQIFIFVHGYNVSFEDAAKRAAQLSYDLDFPGTPMFYSWPSKAETLDYFADEATVEVSILNLKNFISDVCKKSGASSVHLVAHSMGNRCVLNALDSLASEKAIPDNLSEIILTAPDVDTRRFNQVMAKLLASKKHFTLYASNGDKALKKSVQLHKFARAGFADPITVIPPMDTIDASKLESDFVGHSYYGDHKSVVADIEDVILKKKPIKDRYGLRRKTTEQGAEYYYFERPSP